MLVFIVPYKGITKSLELVEEPIGLFLKKDGPRSGPSFCFLFKTISEVFGNIFIQYQTPKT